MNDSVETKTTEIPIIMCAVFNLLVLSHFAALRVKQSLYRPGQAQRFSEGSDSQISRQSARERGKVFSPRHRSPLSPGNIRGTNFC
jgi:hypothetical protein